MGNLKENKQLPEEIQVIIETAIEIYDSLKKIDIVNHQKEVYNNNDKKCLALFMGILKNNNSASEILNDFNITYKQVLDIIDLPEFEKINDNLIKKYMCEFKSLIDIFEDSSTRYYTRDFTPLLLLDKLFLTDVCASNFLDDIYIKLGFINSSQQAYEHGSFSFLTRQLELEQEDIFSSLEKREMLKPKKELVKPKTIGLSAPLGINPFDTDLSLGRDDEVRKLMIALLMPNKSVMLVGPSGVGKTSIVEGLAHKIANQKVPDEFCDKKILNLNVASLLSGTKYRGDFEEKIMKILDEIKDDEDIILFIDEIHTIVGAGKGMNNSNDMANILKPYLESGQIKVIGATTDEEYEKYIKSDSGLKRRFEIVKVQEPNEKTLKSICYNAINKLQLEMDVLFLDDNMLECIIELLIEATSKKNRVYNDIVNNPDFIISIITRSFAIAKYYGKDSVDIDDLIEAIKDNDRLYKHNKIKIINQIKQYKAIPVVMPKVADKCKIIEFNSIA